MSTFSFPVKQRLSFKALPFNGWTLGVSAIAFLIACPVLFVLSHLFVDSTEIWSHLAATVLKDYVVNSLWLMLGVGIGALVIGTSTAWLVTVCRFSGSSWFEWLLLLPLAAPAYLLAYVYTDILDYFGPVQRFLRHLFGWTSIQDYWFPSVRSLPGAIAMLVIVLYPYVYLLARVAFLEQCTCTLEASRSLGCTPWQSFFKVALPLARPSLTAGLALALMETLNDLGTVEYFGVPTFTTGIYRTWLGMRERNAAAQLAAVLLLFVLTLIILERVSRRQARYYQGTGDSKPLQPYQLKGWRAGLAITTCSIPVLLGFLIPCGFLLDMTLTHLNRSFTSSFWQLANHSFILSSITAGLGVVIALIMAYGQRLQNNWAMGAAVRIASMGYAVPGSVIAVGVLIPMGNFDNTVDQWMRSTFNISTGLLLSGTITALIFAYLVRFLAVSFHTVESSLGKIKPSLDEASRSLGQTPTNTLIKIHAPLMGGGLLTAVMLIFVDVMKELPATLVIRPFNFDTLAIRVYQYASDERLTEAAAPALAIILVGLLPVLFLSYRIARSRVC
ncbi:iron ABC transporter permease [Spirulina subsalsa FACHB-351]|uniref:Iron ABC transporter permease n=1 Tax=Spirulina subsalsa FACHB-351 TaxID=234711 RepID=A0ABT3KZW2_9CYAN|nr:iron ABC transporter permease [Spirulina subsalsa]MCW6034791.1 iron ABC transporter permease [Spirulina subsalsa FACHB-351]